ncbi:MAG: serine hydrolase, partial [Gemmatimonadaceae bacterium]
MAEATALPRWTRGAALAFLLLLPACARGQGAGALTPVRADTALLRHTLDSLADAHHGVVGYSIIDLDTGDTLSRRGDETFPTASLIKVSIL